MPGLNIALGCDGAASNDAQNMLEAIKLGNILHNVSDPDYRNWLTPAETLRMATAGGARGVNLGNTTGTISPGMEADLVLYDLDHPSMLPHTEPLQLLVMGHPTEVVEAVWIRGRQLVRQGQIQTIDVSDLYEALRRHPIRKESINRQTIHSIEPHYRNTMLD